MFKVASEIDEACFCSACYSDLEMFYSAKGHSLKEEANVMEECNRNDDFLECEFCHSEIEGEEYYYLTTILNDGLEKMGNILSVDIGGCENCEGNERASFVHAYNDDPFDPESRIEIEGGVDVSEYLFTQGVPEQFNELFTRFIVCPCGYGRELTHPKHNPVGGIFSLEDEIYTQKDVDDFWGFEYTEFMEFAQKYGVFLSVEDIHDFRNHLMKYPMLAHLDKTGQAIYKVLEKHYALRGFPILERQQTPLFRGRIRKKDTPNAYTAKDLWSPPEGKPQHGRFNTVGVPVLYVSDRLNGIPYETHPSDDELIDIAEYELQKDLFVFDIGVFDPGFQGFFTEVNEESSPLKKAYLLPNFIGTCCSHIGYDGVKYKGVHAGNEYTNYALFNLKEDDMIVKKIETFCPEISYTLNPMMSFDSDELHF
jgi:hypothetical protein